ncbi:MAG: hypothetical protein Q7U31_10645 [Anaerolineaceae bacterium]|jgi:hypothetical protein|nr:hypothetical protein [Anaerolineaceae bacterium]PKO01723.1 MAG: hypothetical protein CVU43_11465 [Chloroflexi bacterium HGW-Chloroflexi-5]
MFNTDTEMLFPMRVIPTLGNARGPEWQKLIDHLSEDQTDDSEKIAMTALVVKLAGCAGCNTDSFRAMKGCTQCAHLIVKRFKGNDAELMRNYQDCHKEVTLYLSKRDQ